MTCTKCNKATFVLFEAGLCKECFDQSGLKTAPVKDKPRTKAKNILPQKRMAYRNKIGKFVVRLSPDWYYNSCRNPIRVPFAMAHTYCSLSPARSAARKYKGAKVEELK